MKFFSPSDYGSGSTHYIVGNTFTENVVGLAFAPSAFYYQGIPQVTLRCNTFSTTQTNGVGVWVKAGAAFPSSLGGTGIGNNPPPNGNRFDGITTLNKRFVYEAGGTFAYHRYNSSQEEFSGNGNDQITNLAGTSTATAPNSQIAGTSACGGGTLPGVQARFIVKSPSSTPFASTVPTKIELSTAYPNPANEAVSFTYFLPTDSPSATLVLRNGLGQRVVMQPLPHPGTGEVRLSVLSLPTGLYMGTVEVAGQVKASHKITIVR